MNIQNGRTLALAAMAGLLLTSVSTLAQQPPQQLTQQLAQQSAQQSAQQPGQQPANAESNPFDGRLFPPNVILEHQGELMLTDAQRQEIRAAVVGAQAEIAELQWDLMEAYQSVLAELDGVEIDEDTVISSLETVFATENAVKLTQITMLIRLRNALTQEQFSRLQALAR